MLPNPQFWPAIWDHLKKFLPKPPVPTNKTQSGNINTYNFSNVNDLHLHLTINPEAPPVQLKDKDVIANIANEDLKKGLLDLIKKAYENKEALLISEDADQVFEDYSEHKQEIIGKLEELKEYVSAKEWLIIKSAAYLRKKYEAGENEKVKKLKDGIIYRSGDRGRKITNLMTAGYFESSILPLLHEMKTGKDFTKEKFLEIYDLIVEESGFAVFVHGNMGEADLERKIREKIRSNIRYSEYHLQIHGIGNENVAKIRKVIDTKILKVKGIEKTTEKKTGNSVYIELSLEPKEINEDDFK